MTQPLGPNQELWLQALECGHFKQGKNGLFQANTNGFCCLGVACFMFGAEVHSGHHRSIYFGREKAAAYAPKEVQKALGLYSAGGRSITGKPALATLNDSGTTFADIAAIIREDPGKYFTQPT